MPPVAHPTTHNAARRCARRRPQGSSSSHTSFLCLGSSRSVPRRKRVFQHRHPVPCLRVPSVPRAKEGCVARRRARDTIKSHRHTTLASFYSLSSPFQSHSVVFVIHVQLHYSSTLLSAQPKPQDGVSYYVALLSCLSPVSTPSLLTPASPWAVGPISPSTSTQRRRVAIRSPTHTAFVAHHPKSCLGAQSPVNQAPPHLPVLAQVKSSRNTFFFLFICRLHAPGPASPARTRPPRCLPTTGDRPPGFPLMQVPT